MPKWRIVYNARLKGAIGAFESHTMQVDAPSILEAANIGWEKIHETHEVNFTLAGPRALPLLAGTGKQEANIQELLRDDVRHG